MTRPSSPSLSQRVFNAAAWNTVLFPVQMIVGLVASVLTFRYLQPAEYGVLTLISGLASTLGLYADLGIERSLPRFIPEVERSTGRAGVARFLQRVIVLKLALVCVFIIALQVMSRPLISSIVTNEQTHVQTATQHVIQLQAEHAGASTIQKAERERDGSIAAVRQLQEHGQLFLWAVSALVLFGALYDVCMAFLTAYFKQRAWNIITAIVTLLQPLLIIGFLLLNQGLNGILLGMVVAPVLAVALAAWQTVRAARELETGDVGATDDPTLMRRFIRFAGMSFATQATTWLYDVGVVAFVLTALGMSLDTVALLAFAYTFAKSYLGYAFLPFGGLLTPLFTRIRTRNDQAALQETYSGMTRMFVLLLIPAGVGLAVLTRQMLVLLYPRYVDTAPVIYVLIAFTFLESLISIPHNVLMVYERYWPVLMSRLLALIGIPLLVVLVLAFPSSVLISAAIAVGVARVVPRLLTLLAVQSLMELRFPTRFMGRVVIATVAMSLPLVLLRGVVAEMTTGGVLSKGIALVCLLMLAGLGGVVYLVVLRLLGGLDEQERRRILGLKLPFKATLAKLL